MGGAGPHGLKVLSWLGFPESLHPDFSLFASRITASGFYHAPLTPASSVKSFKSDRNWGVPRHLEARVCLLPSPSLPVGLFSPRQRLLSGRGRHSPRQAAARIPCLPEGTLRASPRQGLMSSLVHLWLFLSHSPPLSSTHIPRKEKVHKRLSPAPHPQPAQPLSSVLSAAGSAHSFVWYFMGCDLLVVPSGPQCRVSGAEGTAQSSDSTSELCVMLTLSRLASPPFCLHPPLFSPFFLVSLLNPSSVPLPNTSARPPELRAGGDLRTISPIPWFTDEETEPTLPGWVPRLLPYLHQGTWVPVGG